MFNFGDNVDREPATVDFRQKKVTNLKVKFVANLSTLSPVCTGPKEADSCLAKCPLHFLRNSIKDDQFSDARFVYITLQNLHFSNMHHSSKGPVYLHLRQ